MSDNARRDRPPTPSSFFLGEEEESKPVRLEQDHNAHLDLANIEERMESSVARQMLKMFRENPDLAAQVVKGMVRKG